MTKDSGLVNILTKSPIELHIPGFRYCGPGTKLSKRLKRGDSGINPLDEACKNHDIAYSQYSDKQNRHNADRTLREQAWTRFLAKNSSFYEKLSAWLVVNAMKAKVKLGMGLQKRKKSGKVSFLKTVTSPGRSVYKKGGDIPKVISAVKQSIKRAGGKKKIKIPRVISVPKTGGFLPFLVPLLAGLSAVGSVAGGAAGVAKAINAARDAKKQLDEAIRHNKAMEAVSLGKGLYLKPYKKGYGLYLKNI